MKILVTGAAGFIGSNFVKQALINLKHVILSVDKLTYSGNLENLNLLKFNKNHNFVKGDIGDKKFIRNILKSFKPQIIVNFAAESHVDNSINMPSVFIETNILGTFNLINECKDYWENLNIDYKKNFLFLHVSTDEVFGSLAPEDKPFTESSKYYPNSPYSASKASSDLLIRAWFKTYGFPSIVTNCSNNYGPFQYPEKLIPLCIVNALSNKILPIYGDGMQIRDWLYVDDHCRALEVIINNGIPGETYNIGGNNEITNIKLIIKLCKLLDDLHPRSDGNSYSSQIEFVIDRVGHDRRYSIDTSKIRQNFDWKPIESIETGLKKTINWFLNNMDWVKKIKNKNNQ